MKLLETVFNALAPYDCLGCSAEGSLLCTTCWPLLINSLPSFPAQPGVDNCWVATAYQGLAKQLVHSMKINCTPQACLLIARAMHQVAPTISGALVVPVPTSPARIRERGFDHGRLIAEEFAHLRGLSCRQLLFRIGKTKQAGSTRQQRAEQVKGIYQLKSRSYKCDQPILVIDDVLTSGATLEEVARVLRQAGAQRVDALVFARPTDRQ